MSFSCLISNHLRIQTSKNLLRPLWLTVFLPGGSCWRPPFHRIERLAEAPTGAVPLKTLWRKSGKRGRFRKTAWFGRKCFFFPGNQKPFEKVASRILGTQDMDGYGEWYGVSKVMLEGKQTRYGSATCISQSYLLLLFELCLRLNISCIFRFLSPRAAPGVSEGFCPDAWSQLSDQSF